MKKILTNEKVWRNIGIGSIVATLALIMASWFFGINPLRHTMSHMGRENVLWFVLFSVSMGVAFLVNMTMLGMKVGIKHWSYYTILGISILAHILQASILGTANVYCEITGNVLVPRDWMGEFHLRAAQVFGFSMGGLMCFIFFFRQKRMKTNFPYPWMMVFAIVSVFMIVFVLDVLTAFKQYIIIALGLTFMLLMNFRHDPKPEDEEWLKKRWRF